MLLRDRLMSLQGWAVLDQCHRQTAGKLQASVFGLSRTETGSSTLHLDSKVPVAITIQRRCPAFVTEQENLNGTDAAIGQGDRKALDLWRCNQHWVSPFQSGWQSGISRILA